MEDDLTGLDDALHGAIGHGVTGRSAGPGSGEASPDLDGVAVRRRRSRRIQAVSALVAAVVVVGLALSQVLAGTAPAPAHRPAGGRPSHPARGARTVGGTAGAVTNGPSHGGGRVAPSGSCRAHGATRPCGVLVTAPGTATTPTGSGTPTPAPAATSGAPSATASGAPGTSSRPVDLAVGEAVAVTLPARTVWAHPSVLASGPADPSAGSRQVVIVRAPAVTGVAAVDGWRHFVVVGDAPGTASVEVPGSCSSGPSCAGGHTRFVLEVHVAT